LKSGDLEDQKGDGKLRLGWILGIKLWGWEVNGIGLGLYQWWAMVLAK